MRFDYAIVGGGPAGYSAGLHLAKNGFSVVLFEKDKIGGTCLNRGCIPTKSMLHSSEIYRNILDTKNLGLDIEIKSFDFSKVIEKRNLTVEKIRKSLELAIKNSGIVIVNQEAEILDSQKIKSGDEIYEANEIIIATGSKPREIKGLEFDHDFILSSDDILELNKLPKSILIIGSGAIGIEWARIFSNFGSEVYIVELAEHLIPLADIEVSKRVERFFKQNKIKFYLKDSIKEIKDKNVTLNSGEILKPEIILSATGRIPNSIEASNLKIIGDANGEVMLAHYAIYQGLNVNNNINLDKKLVPSIIYGEPEIAWFGLREQDCDENCKKTILPITALGKSWCDDSTDGFIKIITKNEKIIGAHIISKEASSLIHQLLIAMQNNLTINDLKKVCFAHPTYSEGIFETLCRI